MNVARGLWVVCALGVACAGTTTDSRSEDRSDAGLPADATCTGDGSGAEVSSTAELDGLTCAQADSLCNELAAEFPITTVTCYGFPRLAGVAAGGDAWTCLDIDSVGFGPAALGCTATVADAINCEQALYADPCGSGSDPSVTSDACSAIYFCQSTRGNTPLVVAFDSQPIHFTSGGTFAFAAGSPVATDLPTATTPWIALDRNHDGTIDNGSELFGDSTVLANGTRPANGFLALAELDANRDGRIDAADPGFASLLLWADRDGDGRSTPDELTPLADTIVSISLADHVEPRCDARSNCEGERASITWRDATGALRAGSVVDVYLHAEASRASSP